MITPWYIRMTGRGRHTRSSRSPAGGRPRGVAQPSPARQGCRGSNAEGELALFTDRQLHLVKKALAMAAIAIERRTSRQEISPL
jgi:hypothetical protein